MALYLILHNVVNGQSWEVVKRMQLSVEENVGYS